MSPIIDDDTLDQHQIPNGAYGYSATRPDDLGATEYTLVTVFNDVSASVTDSKKNMEDTLKEIVGACRQSPRADNLLIRLVQFDDRVEETHGFKLLENCNVDDYDDILRIGGATALFDASENAITASHDYAARLAEQDFLVNEIIFIITDGDDNRSNSTATSVKNALGISIQSEDSESIITVLIGVADSNLSDGRRKIVLDYLDTYHQDAGFTQYIRLEDALSKTLAKVAEFVSKSISAQSQSLGTGGSSVPITF